MMIWHAEYSDPQIDAPSIYWYSHTSLSNIPFVYWITPVWQRRRWKMIQTSPPPPPQWWEEASSTLIAGLVVEGVDGIE